MSKMSETINNLDSPRINETTSPSNSDNESETGKLLRTLCQNNDKCGDWKKDDDFWYVRPGWIADAIGNLEPEKVTEWKYRNMYSMSVSNNHPAYRSPRQVTMTTGKSRKSSEILGIGGDIVEENLSTSENDTKDSDFLNNIREYLANYQELNGTPRGEYSFVSLMKVMGQATGHSLVALFYIAINISPLIQLFLFILRFILDKLISIRNSGYSHQSIVKYAVLGGQLVCIYVCLVFIFGFIVMPILHLVLAILAKLLLFN